MYLLNRLDPRTKILLVLLLTILVFLVDNLFVIAGFMLVVFALRLAANIPFKEVKLLGFLATLVVFLVFVQSLFGPGENYIIKPLFPPEVPLLGGRGSLKWDGFFLGLMLGCRLFTLMLILPLLTETTPHYRIASGLAAFGINYRTVFVITTAFNLVPIFREEGRTIMDAQKLRGMRSFEEGSFFAKLKAYPGLVVPLVLGAMRKAQAASIAMDSRAFGIYKTRTWLEKPVMKIPDYLFLTGGTAFFVLVLLLNHLLK